MRWEVLFSKMSASTFRDASGHGIEVDGDFFESLKAIIDSGKGRAGTGGISRVRREFDGSQPGEFYVLDVDRGGEMHHLLFRLEGERSRLVGSRPQLSRSEVIETLYEILSRRVDGVDLLI